VVALVLFGAHGAAQWHMLFERHTICIEHGEIEDDASVHTAEAEPKGPGTGETILAIPDLAKPSTDHHCPVASSLTQASRPENGVHSLRPGLLRAGGMEYRPATASHPPISILRLAPKHSPPAA
jgi:hypothetical protein